MISSATPFTYSHSLFITLTHYPLLASLSQYSFIPPSSTNPSPLNHSLTSMHSLIWPYDRFISASRSHSGSLLFLYFLSASRISSFSLPVTVFYSQIPSLPFLLIYVPKSLLSRPRNHLLLLLPLPPNQTLPPIHPKSISVGQI